jgi:hypothetical protein
MTNVWINAMASDNGALIYRTGGLADLRRLVWYDRSGKVLDSLPEPGDWSNPTLSPDGGRAAATRVGEVGNVDVFVVDLAKSLFTRFTFDKAWDASPVWSPDGTRIVFSSEREGVRNLYIKAANQSANEEVLLKSAERKDATDWSRDGRFLLYTVRDPKTLADIWVLPMPGANTKSEEAKPIKFLATQFIEDLAQFSPDGRYVAYQSNQSGRNEVYVRSFPDGGTWQLSTETAPFCHAGGAMARSCFSPPPAGSSWPWTSPWRRRFSSACSSSYLRHDPLQPLTLPRMATSFCLPIRSRPKPRRIPLSSC